MEPTENTLCQENKDVKKGIEQILEILTKQNERLDNQEERLQSGDKLFKDMKEFMIKKDIINGYTADDIKEFKDNKKSLEERVSNLEKNTATKDELKAIEEKLPSKTLIYINTIVLVLFVLAVLVEAARDAPVMKFLGL